METLFKMNYPKWTKEELDILAQYHNTKSAKLLTDLLPNRTRNAITSRRQKLGYKLNKESVQHTFSTYHKQYGYFSIWSHQMAYISGFLLADGCLSYYQNRWTIAIHLKREEFNKHILTFISSQLSCPPIPVYINNNAGQPSYEINLGGWRESDIQDLSLLSIFPKKSGKEFLPNVPEEFFYSWLRGFFDGDGTIKAQHIHHNIATYFQLCSGSKQLLTSLRDILFPHVKILNGTRCYQLVCGKKSLIKNIANKMYEHDHCSHAIKKQKFITYGIL